MTTRDERVLPPVLLGLTAVTGLVDAVSYLALGHVFTANMTGNVVFLGFAVAGAQGLSVTRSGSAVAAFFIGAVIGGRARVGARPLRPRLGRLRHRRLRRCQSSSSPGRRGRTPDASAGMRPRRSA